jgi:nucleotide-binding universal stress UspA family protein
MARFTTILCPVDFSDHSRLALRHALAVAQGSGGRVIVLHVFPGPAGSPPALAAVPGAPGLLTADARERLLDDLRRWVRDGSASEVPLEAEIGEGDPAGVIVGRAQAAAADLLVLGTHGRTGFQHLLLGSVTEKVLRTAACPVLTVPRRAPEGAEAEVLPFARILCPVDFSESSLRALQYAASLAEQVKARLTALHVPVYEMEPTPEMHDSVIAEGRLTMSAFRRAVEERARQGLEEAVRDVLPAVAAVDMILVPGTPWKVILRVADEQRADVIVMGVHGRGAVSQRFVGSTTNHVVRQAVCPVLTLRSGDVR